MKLPPFLNAFVAGALICLALLGMAALFHPSERAKIHASLYAVGCGFLSVGGLFVLAAIVITLLLKKQ